MKRKLTPKQKQLQAEFDAMMRSHAQPLERGARAKGVTAQGTLSRRASPLLESKRVNRQASVDTGYSSTQARPVQQYTGDKMLGISQMHKSNMVPVFNSEAAQDITKMRRG